MVVLGKTKVVFYSLRHAAEKWREAPREGEEQRKRGEEKELKGKSEQEHKRSMDYCIADV